MTPPHGAPTAAAASKPLRVATRNPGKLREFAEILTPLGYLVQGIEDLPDVAMEETGDTFVANAIIKAQAIYQATGVATIADDSGLAVDALDGAPGVYSARYAAGDVRLGEDQDSANRRKLLQAMEHVADGAARNARFVCAIAFCDADGGQPKIFEATFEGQVATSEAGQGGFGYDSIFHVPEHGCTSAELRPEQKNQLSHRGKALRAFAAYVKEATRSKAGA